MAAGDRVERFGAGGWDAELKRQQQGRRPNAGFLSSMPTQPADYQSPASKYGVERTTNANGMQTIRTSNGFVGDPSQWGDGGGAAIAPGLQSPATGNPTTIGAPGGSRPGFAGVMPAEAGGKNLAMPGPGERGPSGAYTTALGQPALAGAPAGTALQGAAGTTGATAGKGFAGVQPMPRPGRGLRTSFGAAGR